MRKLIFLFLAPLLTLLLAGPAVAQTAAVDDESVMLRINGDVTVPAGEDHGVVVVIEGDLRFDGTADTVVVINGDAELVGASLETLVVISGSAVLGPDTTVTGDVRLIDSTLTRDGSATVEGDVTRGAGSDVFSGFWIIGLLFMIGWTILVVLAGLVLAAVAPDLARRAGRTITADLGPTIVAGLILWVAVPIVSIFAFATIVGIPTAVAIWLVVLPAMAFVGFLVAGVRVGEYITERGGSGVGHPYLASVVGLGALIIVGAIPIIGPIVVLVAGFLGSGSLALQAVRAVRRRPQDVPPVPIPAPSR